MKLRAPVNAAVERRDDSSDSSGIAARSSRTAASTRSAYRPSQYRLSATRLGRSNVARLTAMGDTPAGISGRWGSAASPATQTSLLLPPPSRVTSREPVDDDTRPSPPGSTS